MAEIVRRRSWGGVLPLGLQASISGSRMAQCASVSITPPLSRGAKRRFTKRVQERTGLSLDADPSHRQPRQDLQLSPLLIEAQSRQSPSEGEFQLRPP